MRQKTRTRAPRIHREYFRTVLRGGRKSCPRCQEVLPPGEFIYCLGQYVNAKWHNVSDFCVRCWPRLRDRLREHERNCPDHCTVQLVGYHGQKPPPWLTM